MDRYAGQKLLSCTLAPGEASCARIISSKCPNHITARKQDLTGESESHPTIMTPLCETGTDAAVHVKSLLTATVTVPEQCPWESAG